MLLHLCQKWGISKFTGYVVFIITLFLVGIESRDQCLVNSELKFCPAFLGSYCTLVYTAYNGLYRVHCPVYLYMFPKSICIPEYTIPYHCTIKISWVHCSKASYNITAYTSLYRVHWSIQSTLVYTEYTVQSQSVHQIYTHFRVKLLSLYIENILSALFTILNSLELDLKSLFEYPVGTVLVHSRITFIHYWIAEVSMFTCLMKRPNIIIN